MCNNVHTVRIAFTRKLWHYCAQMCVCVCACCVKTQSGKLSMVCVVIDQCGQMGNKWVKWKVIGSVKITHTV